MRPTPALAALALFALAAAPAAAIPLLENPWLDRHPLHIAHQGGAIEAPSNTLYAFEEALRKGADVLEMDVHATADGHLVVIHDATVDRTTDGAGRVSAMTLVEIQRLDAAHWFVPGRGVVHGRDPSEYVLRGIATGDKPPPPGFAALDFRVPTLDEVLARFPGAWVNLEIKDSAPDVAPYEAALAALLAAHGRGRDTLVVAFDDHSVEAFKVLNREVGTAMGTAQTAAFWASAQGAAPGSPSRHHALQPPMTYQGLQVVTPELIAKAHANGLAVHVWTINDRETMEALLDAGVDGIMTDRPALLEEVLRERAAR